VSDRAMSLADLRYVTAHFLLRTHTSAIIPGLLRALALDPPADMLLVCPGLVYRRDSIDRLHTGEPHQLDLWRIKRGRLTVADLHTMVQTVVQAAVPGARFRVVPASHLWRCEQGASSSISAFLLHYGMLIRVCHGDVHGYYPLRPKRILCMWALDRCFKILTMLCLTPKSPGRNCA
jgi:hypothetical protein